MSCFLRVLPLFLLLTTVHCGGSDSDNAPQDSSTTDAGSATNLPCEDGDTIDLAGTYAVFARLDMGFSSKAGGAVQVYPPGQTGAGTFLMLMNLEPDSTNGTGLKATAHVCNVTLPAVSAAVGSHVDDDSSLIQAEVLMPDALLSAFPSASQGSANGQLASLEPGAALELDRMHFSLGAAASEQDVPSWDEEADGCGMDDTAAGRTAACEDACVTNCDGLIDHDGDQWPGVTVHVCGYTEDDRALDVACHPQEPNQAGATIQGRVAVTLQVDPVLRGQAVSSCELRGNLETEVRYGVVGGDVYVANTQISVSGAMRSLPEYDVNGEESIFRAIRVDGVYGSPDWGVSLSDPVAGCTEVLQRQNEIL